MGLDYSPKVVRSGLVLALDSTDINSYPGSGTTWYDLSGYGNHGTLTTMNSPSAGNTSGFDTTTKYMMFDRHVGASDAAANNRVIIQNSTSLQEVLCQNGMTIDMWFRETSTQCTAFTKWDGSWELYYCSTMVFRTQGTNGSDYNSSVSSSPGTWRNIVATHDGTNIKMYANTISGMVNVLSSTNSVSSQNTSNVISIGAYSNGSYASVGAIPIYRLYNRALTEQEILQNYLAQKNRFRI